MTSPALVRAPAAAARELARSVVVEPVREGRLRGTHWPVGLRAIVVLAYTAFVAAAVLVVAARPVREHSALSVGASGELVFPRWALFLFLLFMTVALALLHAASLHLARWLRLLVLLAVVVVVMTTATDPFSLDRAPHVATWVGCGLLVLLTAVRWRADFAWWEFAVSFLAVGATIAAAFRLEGRYAGPLGYDTAPVGITLFMQALAILATPFIFVSGIAFAQLALLLASRAGAAVDQQLRRGTGLAVLTAVVGVADLVLAVRRLRAPTDFGASHLAVELSGLGLLLAVLVWAVTQVHPDVDPGPDAEPGLAGLPTATSVVAMPVAVLMTGTVLAALLVSRVDIQIAKYRSTHHLVLGRVVDALDGSRALEGTRFGAGLLLVAFAVWQRRRLPVVALVAGSVGLALAASWARRVSGGAVDLPWTPESVNDGATVLATATLVVLAARRGLTRTRLLALGIALGIALAWSVRSTFDAPFVALFGLGATAAVFLGLIWAMVTGAGEANLDSDRYPRPARVLFFLGNGVLAMAVLAFGALGRTQSVGLDTQSFGSLGDAYLGTGLLLAAYGLLAVAVVHDRAPLPDGPARQAEGPPPD